MTSTGEVALSNRLWSLFLGMPKVRPDSKADYNAHAHEEPYVSAHSEAGIQESQEEQRLSTRNHVFPISCASRYFCDKYLVFGSTRLAYKSK